MKDAVAQPGVQVIDHESGLTQRFLWNGSTFDPRPVAGFWRKVGCLIVDVIIFVVIGGLTSQLIALPLGMSFEPDATSDGAGLVALVVLAAVWLVYFSAFYVKAGRTPGMMLGRLWVVDVQSGDNITWVRALARAVVLGIGLVAGCLTIVWALWAGMSSERRGPHDEVAKSVVLAGRKDGA